MDINVTSNLTVQGDYLVGLDLGGFIVTMTSDEALRLGQRLLVASGHHFKVMPDLQQTVTELHRKLHTEGLDPHDTVALLLATQQLRGIEQLLDEQGD